MARKRPMAVNTAMRGEVDITIAFFMAEGFQG